MPMIWLDLKEAGEFQFSPSVRQVSWVWSEATGLRSKVKKTGIEKHRHIPVNKLVLTVVYNKSFQALSVGHSRIFQKV